MRVLIVLSTLVTLMTLSLLPLGAHAQSSLFVAIDPETACEDFHHREVHVVEIHALGDVGRAEYNVYTGPIIMIDPDLMTALPVKLQQFFRLHECAHHVLGHLFAPTDRSETEADAWAIHRGRDQGLFTRAEIEHWRPFFANSLGSRFGHLPGQRRVDFLLRSYDEP